MGSANSAPCSEKGRPVCRALLQNGAVAGE